MKKCPNCNTEFDEANDKCPNCGNQVVDLPANENTEPVTAEVITPSAPINEAKKIEPENLSILAFSGRMGRKAFIMRWVPLALVTMYLSWLASNSSSAATMISLYMIIVPFTICGIGFKLRRLIDIGRPKWQIYLIVALTLLPVLDLFIALYLILKKGRYETIY